MKKKNDKLNLLAQTVKKEVPSKRNYIILPNIEIEEYRSRFIRISTSGKLVSRFINFKGNEF